MNEKINLEDQDLYADLKDTIDIHIHIGPDAVRQRRVNAIQAAEQARAAGMRAIILKNKQFITTPLAQLASTVVPGILVFGGVCLDREVGGLNPEQVDLAGKLGTKIVWMPTETAEQDMSKKRAPLMSRQYRSSVQGIRALDGNGRILPVLDEILEIIKEYDMVLATGHFSTEEILALIARAKQKGIRRILVNHPLTISFGPTAPLPKQKEMADMGAWIEHTFVPCMPAHDRLDPGKIVEAILEIGAERTILSTDFGQIHNPAPVEGMRMLIRTMLGLGITQQQVDLMVKHNPAELLGLS